MGKIVRLFAVLCVLMSFVCPSYAEEVSGDVPELKVNYVEGQVVMMMNVPDAIMKAGVTVEIIHALIDEVAEAVGAKKLFVAENIALSSGSIIATLASTEKTTEELISELGEIDDVISATLNYQVRANEMSSSPCDPK